jgi:hypothetical protein
MNQVQYERRAKQRFSVQLPILISASGPIPESSGVTRDVSTGGVFFYTEFWPAETGTIEFLLTLPSEITLSESIRVKCHGRIMRVIENLEGGKTGVAATIDSYTWT